MSCADFRCSSEDECEILYNVGFCDCAFVGDCETCKEYHTCDKKFEDGDYLDDWSETE